MKNWILILGLLSLHGCRVFNSEPNINKYSHSIFHDDSYNLSIVDESSENSDGSSKGIKHLWIAAEEEQEHLFLHTLPSLKEQSNSFLFNKREITYCIRNLPDKFHADIYIFCKALII